MIVEIVMPDGLEVRGLRWFGRGAQLYALAEHGPLYETDLDRLCADASLLPRP
jgi:hypothetical protein